MIFSKGTVEKYTFRFQSEDVIKDKEKIKEFLNEIDSVDENEVRFYDFVTSYAPDLCEGGFFVKDYPVKAKIIVEIFERYLKGELRKENENKTDTIVDLLKKQEFYEKEKLTKFAERLKEKMYEKEKGYIELLSGENAVAVDIVDFENCLDETLKEFIDE